MHTLTSEIARGTSARHANIITLLHAYFITNEARAVKAAMITTLRASQLYVFKTSPLIRMFEHNTALTMQKRSLSDISCVENSAY